MVHIMVPAEIRKALSLPGPQCMACMVNGDASIIIKHYRTTLAGFRGNHPVGFRSEAGLYPEGAVIRLVIDIYDKPDAPYTCDTFLNPASQADLDLLTHLTIQSALNIHMFDQYANYSFTKQIPFRDVARADLLQLLDLAKENNQKLESVDFQAAKEHMMADRPTKGRDK